MRIHFRLVLEQAIRHIAVESINRIVFCQHRDIRVVDLVNIVRNRAVQILNLILIISGSYICFPTQFSGQIDGVQTHFQALVSHFTGIRISSGGIFKSRCDGDGCLHQHIPCLFQISIQWEYDPWIEQGSIKTDIRLCHLFPMDVRIGKRRGNQCSLIAARCSEWIYTGVVRCQVTIIADTCLATRHSISYTYFQVVHNVILREPAFLRNAPCGRYRRKSTPTVLFTETAGTITADSCRQHIAVFVRVVDTCHVRE